MSNIIVQKFGGTSVGSEERIAAVAKIIKDYVCLLEAVHKTFKFLIILSALPIPC